MFICVELRAKKECGMLTGSTENRCLETPPTVLIPNSETHGLAGEIDIYLALT